MKTSDETMLIDPEKIRNHPIMKYTPKRNWDGMMYRYLKQVCDNAAAKKFEVFFCENCTDVFFIGVDYRGPGANMTGSLYHWYMYLAYELMFLVDEKKISVDDAWYLVCFNSQELFQKEGMLKWKSFAYPNVVVRADLNRYDHCWMDVGAKSELPLASFANVVFSQCCMKNAFCVRASKG